MKSLTFSFQTYYRTLLMSNTNAKLKVMETLQEMSMQRCLAAVENHHANDARTYPRGRFGFRILCGFTPEVTWTSCHYVDTVYEVG